MTAAGQPAPAAASKGSPYVELTKVRARNISIRIDQSTGWREPEWPVVVGSIPPQADCYQDRPAALAKLIGTATGRTAVHAEPARVVSGLGGVGKTQLAAGHARQLCQDKAVDVLVWVPASTRTGIVTRFAQAAEAVGAAAADDPEAACERFLGWLASTDRPWLIVFDDLAAADDVRGLWPPDYRPDGRTVVTTRRRDASLLAGRQLIDLEVFTVEEAGAYLRERLPAELADDIGGVATDLGCLPLALAQAAALMLDTELPCSGYRERFADRRRRLAEAFPHPDTLFDDTTATVATTWSISIEQANRLPPAGLAGRLLELASVLDPNGIPTAVFTTADALTFLTKDIAPTSWWRRRRRRAALTDDSVREGLANLRRFNLVAVAGSVIQVHALVQRAARDHFGPAEAQTVVQAAADALLNTWPDHARDATLTALLRANATNLAAAAGAGALWHSALGGHLVLYQAMSSLADDGLLTAAIEAATELHQQAHTRLGPDHPYTLTTRVYMAQFRGQAGDAVGAAEAFERVLADRRRVLGDDHPHALSARYNMLFWRVEAGADAADAAEALELVLYDMLRVLGPDHPHTLAARTSVAHCRGKAGDAEGAVAALEQVVADRLRIDGPDHGDTLMARGLLAEWRGKAGDVAGAAVTFEQVHADRTRVLGLDDPQTLGGRGSLAFWQGEAGDPAGAAAAFGELLTDMLRVLGPDHPYTLNTRDELERWEREAARDSRVDE